MAYPYRIWYPFLRSRYPQLPLITLRRLAQADLHRLSLLRPQILGDPPPLMHGSALERMELPQPDF